MNFDINHDLTNNNETENAVQIKKCLEFTQLNQVKKRKFSDYFIFSLQRFALSSCFKKVIFKFQVYKKYRV
jgi:hypothetical protein